MAVAVAGAALAAAVALTEAEGRVNTAWGDGRTQLLLALALVALTIDQGPLRQGGVSIAPRNRRAVHVEIRHGVGAGPEEVLGPPGKPSPAGCLPRHVLLDAFVSAVHHRAMWEA